MAWSPTPLGAVPLLSPTGDEVGHLTATGTGTVNAYEALGRDALRMFGVMPDAIGGGGIRWTDSVEFSTDQLWPDDPITDPAAADPDLTTRLVYIKPPDDLDPEQRFVLQAVSSPTDPNKPLVQTLIPLKREGVNWTYTVVYYGTEAPDTSSTVECCDDDTATSGRVEEYQGEASTWWNHRDQTGMFAVQYGHPNVVRLSDGTWLMLLARTRRCTCDDDKSGADYSLGDIVAYRSSETDPTFTDVLIRRPNSGHRASRAIDV